MLKIFITSQQIQLPVASTVVFLGAALTPFSMCCTHVIIDISISSQRVRVGSTLCSSGFTHYIGVCSLLCSASIYMHVCRYALSDLF